jgi:methionyl-tRNA formyltransferase
MLNFYFAEETETTEEVTSGTVLLGKPKEGLLVKCGDGAVRITQLQPSGGKVMPARDFLNGGKVKGGMRFDQPVL